jgi:hypothetical protein
VLLTKNPADFLALHLQHPDHSGILVVYQDNDIARDMTDMEIVEAIGRLEASYAAAEAPLAGGFHILNHWRAPAVGPAAAAPQEGEKAGRKKRRGKGKG